MLTFIRRRLELKIIIALVLVIGCIIGIFTFVDMKMMRDETIHASAQSLGALAGAIKGNINAAMRKGQHEDIQRILEDARIPFVIDRIVIYDAQGKSLRRASGKEDDGFGTQIPQSIVRSVIKDDQTEVHERGSRYYLSYFSPIVNRPECYQCHGKKARLNGILRIDFSLRGIDRLITSHRNRSFLWTGIMIAALMAALVVLLRSLVHKPVKDLRSAMEHAEDGNARLFISLEEGDELADLKKSFVGMLDKIHALHKTNLEKEKELARNQEIMRFRTELQAMFDAMPDGVLLIDPDMKILQGNPRVYDMLPGLPAVGGKITPDCVEKDACPFQGIEAVLKHGRVAGHQCSVKLPDGEQRHLHSISAPITEEGRVAYVVEVIRDVTERIKTELELEEKTAELLATNRLLSRIAITDSLTQLYNRRHFDELLYKEVKRFKRRKYAYLSLMMIDIDHFKMLNDRYGHLAGDNVLREMAKLLKEGVRETDTIARYGGEEFVIIMPDTHIYGAAHKAEKLRKKVQDTEFPGQNKPVHITISIGLAAYAAGLPQDLVKAADEALYEAKHSGRNMIALSKVAVAAGGTSSKTSSG